MVIYKTDLLKTLVFKGTKKSKANLHLSNNLQRKAYKYQLENQAYKQQQGVGIYRHQQDIQVYENSQDLQIYEHQ